MLKYYDSHGRVGTAAWWVDGWWTVQDEIVSVRHSMNQFFASSLNANLHVVPLAHIGRYYLATYLPKEMQVYPNIIYDIDIGEETIQ